MKQKHAFLILAHNEFKVLQHLVDSIDDARNDIYIHIDRKVKILPEIIVKNANVFMLDGKNRIDVSWGHVSQIEAEFSLFDVSAKNASYRYYHILSGTHLPLINQNKFHDFFNLSGNKQFFERMPFSSEELLRKGNQVNLMMKFFSKNRFAQKIWRFGSSFQQILNIKINKETSFIKASNWVSITEDALKYLLKFKKEILKKYKYSMCGDELFIPTELSLSNENFILDFSENYLFHKIGNANSSILTMSDFPAIESSNALFARKFSSDHFDLIEKVQNRLKS